MKQWILRLILLIPISPALGMATELTLLQEQARHGDAESQYQLAQSYQNASTETGADQNRLYWLKQAAAQGHISAMEQLAYRYLTAPETPENTEHALRWLIKLTSLGQTLSAITIGEIYQRGRSLPETLTMAELWYYSVADREIEAEQRYSLLLQKKFDQQRAKQISNMTALEKASVHSLSPSQAVSNIKHEPADEFDSPNLFLVGLFLLILMSALFFYWLSKRNARLPHPNQLSQTEQLHEQARVIQQQKRQLDKLYRELARRQQKQTHQLHEQQWILACALFGFSPEQLPNERTIKTRYKQLSKIYHPDAQGSDEEMKRLNSSLNLILQKINK